ncbi:MULTISPECIES: DUF6499 domain-containing protein [unclassified Mesorhizobium]|uniref:transcriptional regulator domain-containing protein n=1 Tax=unclassified Mesorhizobium TaxID=325217 RepID=UPI001092F979|nr:MULTISPECIES: DUF6499 domain-containing protein [unclassified Mesorhizobium]TGS43728.1 hypothetical protein EN825_16935 [Mesorhizobium sp. M8A.F.Ca.ET.182.01.1.1]TGS78309.1 hypothetical protein EN824_26400 [Mesorhizobium sp. M8A.F.Ca.ET.181.01.1.1]TGV15448.1 hypothetical protein EN816_08595 [Mesorhizobium sp. M8A.F.Ca.ET.173.01.1.1]
MITTDAGRAWPDWQDEEGYAYCAQLTSLGWAWEFLRRNPLFLRDLALASHSTEPSRSPAATVISLATLAIDLSSWGLIFCKLECQ